jgi:peptidoglycan/LPS O-acetylase OafA/YrhL
MQNDPGIAFLKTSASAPPRVAVDDSLIDRATVVTRPHIDFLDGMRGLAALYVCLGHAVPFSDGMGDTTHRILRLLLTGGHAAVTMFIVVSGYCMMLPYLDGRPIASKEFWQIRALRILPPYYCALLISIILGFTLDPVPNHSFWRETPPTLTEIATHVFMLQDLFYSMAAQINYVLWSVGVEWKIYFLFPLLLMAGRRFGFIRSAFIATILSYAVFAVQLSRDWLNPDAFGSSVYYVGMFAAGMATAVLVDRARQRHLKVHLKLLAAALLLFALATYATEFKKVGMLQVASIFSGGFTCLLIAWLALRDRSALKNFLSKRALIALGRISFSLYLIHPPVLQMVQALFLDRYFLNSTLLLPVTLVVSLLSSLVAALLFYELVEAPSLRLIRAFKLRRQAVFAPVAESA